MRRFPCSTPCDDVAQLKPGNCDVVLGGWPCQDISVAGRRAGIEGTRSSLFRELLRVGRESRATTLVMENVPNLLRMSGGVEFIQVLNEIADSGFRHISWRTLNAREFGIPHQRRRLLMVASKNPATARALHRPINQDTIEINPRPTSHEVPAGFYWTAGTHGISYSPGYIPTFKVGSGINIPSPVAVFAFGSVRRISPLEAIRLQGFCTEAFHDWSAAVFSDSGCDGFFYAAASGCW